jgi:hypothetical protein
MKGVRVACLSAAVVLVVTACTGTPDTPAPPSPETSPSPTESPEVEEPSPEPPPGVIVPDVVGEKLPSARTTLRQAELRPRIERRPSNEPPGTVLSQSPVAGREVREGRTVRLVVAKPKPPPPPPQPNGGGGNCHPSYTGACLDPNASDYDCAGGSGDGPKYTGTVTVVGPDEFDLDADGDGVGCE